MQQWPLPSQNLPSSVPREESSVFGTLDMLVLYMDYFVKYSQQHCCGTIMIPVLQLGKVRVQWFRLPVVIYFRDSDDI